MNTQSFQKVRVRYAPSPTGYLHVGGARSALYNYLYAKNKKGDFILRIEDTDQARSTVESLKMMIEDLQWLGLHWDEGPDPITLKDKGSFGPYKQSERQSIYKKVADELLNAKKAYYCFMTDEEIDLQREKLKLEGRQPHINSPYQDWPLEKAIEKIKSGARGSVRFKTKGLQKDYKVQDLVRGQVVFPSDMVGDFVLLRSDGMPVYNFCCVVDDHLMQISHVLRAEEHLSNTLRQLMVYEAMNWPLPQFGHMSLVLDEDRQKLSKRKGATSCFEFKSEGYLPEAMINFLAFLGWSHPDEKDILSMNEMIEAFDVTRLNPSGAIFDVVKLKWMNSQHLRALSDIELWNRIEPFLVKAKIDFPKDPVLQNSCLQVFKPAMETLADSVPLFKLLIDSEFKVEGESSEVLGWEPSKAVIKQWIESLKNCGHQKLTGELFVKIQDEVKSKTGAKGKNLFQPLRVAVIGKPHGPDLKLLAPLIPVSSLVARAEETLGAMA
jgi:nondiscriminating glutamyl-tRNA synthetase